MINHFLFILLLTLSLIIQITSLKDITLAYSSKASKIILPSPTKGTQKTAHTYGWGVPKTPESIWIWAGYGNEADCPMNITIQDQFKLTCLSRTISLTAAADNEFSASFFGKTLFGNNLLVPSTITIDSKDQTCNGVYKFTVEGRNWEVIGRANCSGGNLAALIYGVTQKQCCQDTSYYLNSSTCKCYPCSGAFSGCLNCTATACTTCNAAGHFLLSGTKCKCDDQYALDGSVCKLCNQFLSNCLNCDNKTACTNCEVGYKLNPTTHKCQKCQVGCLVCDYDECFICDVSKQFSLHNLTCICNQTSGIDIDECKLCSVMMVNCTSCVNGTFCTSCQDQNMINAVTRTCDECPVNCLSCQYSSGCVGCDIGYQIVLGKCESICGDGILLLTEGEECDDGNALDGDGCSTNCLVESDHQCVSKNKDKSNCSYSGAFRLFVKWVKKEYYENRINISIGIRPIVQNLDIIDFNRVTFFNQTLLNRDYYYDNNGTLYLHYQYLHTLQSKYSVFVFSPSSYYSNFLATPNSTLLIELTTNSNIPITFYSDQQQYLPASLIEKILIGLVSFSYLLVIGGLVVNRMVCLQLFLVWQVSFLSLGTIDKIQPILSTLFSFRIVNGYNWVEPKDNRYVPDRINSIQYSPNLYQNFNFNLVLLIVVGILPIVVNKILSRATWKTKSKFKLILRLIEKQYSLFIVVFVEINLGFVIGIQILYGQLNIINILILGVGVIIMGFVVSAFPFTEIFKGQFYYLYKYRYESKLYAIFNIIYRFFIGLTMALFNQAHYVCLYSLFLSVCFLAYQLSVRPYKLGYLNYQSIFCQLCIVVILGIRMFYRTMKNNYPIQHISKILIPGYLEIGLIFICIVLTFGVLIKQALRKFSFKSPKIIKTQMPNIQIVATNQNLNNNTLFVWVEQDDTDQQKQKQQKHQTQLAEQQKRKESHQQVEEQIPQQIEEQILQEQESIEFEEPNIEFQDLQKIVYII